MEDALRACIEGGVSLPPEAFTSQEFARLEQERLWPLAWVALACNESLPNDDERVPTTWRGWPVFMQRRAGGLEVYPNVCTHAWHTLVDRRTRGQALTCPQHGRMFRTDGTCKGQPGLDGPGFPAADDDLRRLRSRSLGPIVMAANAGSDDQPVLDAVAASLHGLDLSTLEPYQAGSGERDVVGNWKQHAANYLDNLHIRFVHAGSLGRSVDIASYQTEIHDGGVVQWAQAKDARHAMHGLSPRFGAAPFALWWFIWPNTALNFYPWGLSMNILGPGDRPDRTRFSWHCWRWDNDLDPQDWSLRDADREDTHAIEHVTVGVGSGFAKPGRFAPGEQGVQWFHQSVARAVTRSQ